MSEQRYGVHHCPNGFYYLRDVTDHSVYIHKSYGYLYSPYKEDIELVSILLNELADKVDEQQATITALKEDKAIAEDYANIFEKENVKLRKKLNNYKATVLGFLWIMEENGRISGKDDDFVKDLFKLIDGE